MRTSETSLFRRIVWSHALLVAVLGVACAAAIFGLYYRIEDQAMEGLLRAALVRSVESGEADGTGLPAVWRAQDAPEDFAALFEGLDPPHTPGQLVLNELEDGGVELHMASMLVHDGELLLAVIESRELGLDPWLAIILVSVVILLCFVAMVVGYAVARRTLTPLQALASQLESDSLAVEPAGLRAAATNDEVGVLARQLATFLEEREAALERERLFLRDASHELRNPLSVLSGAVELLKEMGPGDEATYAERLARMQRSVERMRRTVEELLVLARQECQVNQSAELPLVDSVLELIQEFQEYAEPSVVITLQSEGEPAGSATLWLVILRNLLENAIHGTEEGEVVVQLQKEVVSVTDTGCGIDPKQAAGLAEPFVGGSESRGFGLGLAIVQRLVDRIGWVLEIESTPSGTCVQCRASQRMPGPEFRTK